MGIGQAGERRWGSQSGSPDSPRRARSANAGVLGGLSELFSGRSASRPPTARSPRSFGGGGGAVGLGIVAAMCGSLVRSSPPRSDPMAIDSATTRATAELKQASAAAAAEDELSESYTCVIWRVGGCAAVKRVYFEEGSVF